MRVFDEYAATTAPRARADRGGPERATPLLGVQALALQQLAGNRAVSGMLALQRDACCAGCAEGGECADSAAGQGSGVASDDQQTASAP
jgi:hypothetical protein